MAKGGWMRRILWAGVALLGMVLMVVVALVAINLMDEDVAPGTRALMTAPPGGRLDERNGFVDFLGMGAPAGSDAAAWGRKAAAAFAAQVEPGFRRTPEWEAATRSHLQATKEATGWCNPEKTGCLALAREKRAALATELVAPPNAEIMARYRVAREKPEFTDLSVGSDLLAILPPYTHLTHAAALARLDIALKAVDGDLEGAVAELEREAAFHRRQFDGARSLVALMVPVTMHARDLLLASDLLREAGETGAPFRARLLALVAAPVPTAPLERALKTEAAMGLAFASGLRARMRAGSVSDSFGVMGLDRMGPTRVMSFFVRENDTLNRLGAAYASEMQAASVPAAGFVAARDAVRAQRAALAQLPWHGYLANPVGKVLVASMLPELSSYAGRLHDLEALRRMVRLQAMVAERGLKDAGEIQGLIAAEGAAGADPSTGQPFALDPATRTISYAPLGSGGYVQEWMKRGGGRAAIRL